jgi:hypothetical protein
MGYIHKKGESKGIIGWDTYIRGGRQIHGEKAREIGCGTPRGIHCKKTILESLISGNIFYLYEFFACLYRKKNSTAYQ